MKASHTSDSMKGPKTKHLFIVKETTKGRIHFSGFGISTGGKNRDTEFYIQVKDANGKIIATSSQSVTATRLGIASRGRRDYDQDKYHQTDFFIKQGNKIKPNSPIALKIAWK